MLIYNIKNQELTVVYSKLAKFQKKIKEEERICEDKEQQLALEKQIEDRIGVRMTEWDKLEKEKKQTCQTERVVKAQRIAHLEHTIREK